MAASTPNQNFCVRYAQKIVAGFTVLFTGLLLLYAAPSAHAGNVTVSGFAYQDQSGSTKWSGCNGTTQNIRVYYSMTPTSATGPCNATTGAFAITLAMSNGNGTVVVYLDGAGAANGGVTYSRNAVTSGSMTVDVTRQRITIQSDTASNIANGHIDHQDGSDDPDIPVNVSAGVLTGSVADTEIFIPASETFVPGGPVTIPALDIGGTYVGSAGATDTLTGGGNTPSCTAPTNQQQPLCVRSGGLFNPPANHTTDFVANVGIMVSGQNYANLRLLPTNASAVTYRLGDSSNDVFTISETLTIGNGTHGVIADTGQNKPTINATGNGSSGGNIIINANASLSGNQPGTMNIAGSLTGGGTLTLNRYAAHFIFTYNDPGRTIGSTSGSQDWLFGSLGFQSNQAVAQTIRTSTGGTGSLKTVRGLELCESGPNLPVVLDANTNDRRIEVGTDLQIARSCTLQASSSQPLVIGRAFRFANSGTFVHNAGTVELTNPVSTGSFDQGKMLALYNLSVTQPEKAVRFDSVDLLRVEGTLTINGGSCASRIALSSFTYGDAADLQVWNWAVNYADVGDLTAVVGGGSTAGITTNSYNSGNNTSFTFNTPCATTVGAVTGFARDPETGTKWAACDGVTPNVRVAMVTGRPAITSCNATTGAFTVTQPLRASSSVMAVYLDGGNGITYVRTPNPSAPSTGVVVGPNYATITALSSGTFTDNDIARFSKTFDPLIPITAPETWTTTTYAITLDAGVELRVAASTDFAPQDSVTTDSLDIRGTYTQTGLTLLALRGSGTGNCAGAANVQRPLCVSPGGSTTFDGMSTTHYLGTSQLDVEGDAYGDLHLRPSGPGLPTYNLGAGTSNTMTTRQLQIGVSDGVIASTTKYNASIETIPVFGGASVIVAAGSSLTGTGTNPVKVAANFTGEGTVNLPNAPLQMRADSASTTLGPTPGAANWVFGSIEVSNNTGSATTMSNPAGGTGSITTGNLTIGRVGDAGSSTLDLNLNDRALDVNGSLSILSGSTLLASNTQPLTIADDFSNAGTFTANGGTVIIDDAALQSSITHSAATSFANLTASTPNEVLLLDNNTQTNVTGTLTINGGACNSRITMRSVVAADNAALNVTGTANVSFVDIFDSQAVTALTASRATNGGGNSGWTMTTNECATISFTLLTPMNTNMGTVVPGTTAVTPITLDVTTNNATGYQVTATDESNSWGADCVCGDTITDWTGTSATPTVWAANTTGIGINVRSAGGGRLAKWGSAGGPYPITDYTNNRYAGLKLGTSTILHSTTSTIAGTYTIDSTYRANSTITNKPGIYDTTITLTVTANP